jgi:hypothetical protein
MERYILHNFLDALYSPLNLHKVVVLKCYQIKLIYFLLFVIFYNTTDSYAPVSAHVYILCNKNQVLKIL